MTALVRITDPAVEPISLVEAKAHLRVDNTDEDDLISLYIRAARTYMDGEDGFLGRALITQTWELVLDAFPTHEIKIPLPPLQSVTSVKYDDTDGFEQTFAAAGYYVDSASEHAWLVPLTAGWPTTIDAVNSVRIRYVAGYPADTNSPPDLAANVPFSIKAAMLLLIGQFYALREEAIAGTIITKLPMGVESLLRPYRMQLGMA